MSDWALRIPNEQASAAGQLRDCADVMALQDAGAIWLRGLHSEELVLRITALPGDRFHIHDDGQLTLFGNRVPSARLPDGHWMPLAIFIEPTLPTPGYATSIDSRVPLKLTRSNEHTQANAILVQRDHWLAYIDTAPAIRLKPLRFAAAVDGRALVIGEPLPPLPGEHFWFDSNIAAPAGFRFTPAVSPSTARRVFDGDPNDIVLWTTSENWELIPADSIVSATRVSVRATLAMEGRT